MSTVQELEKKLQQQQATLDTYKETLSRIYELYDAKIEELSLIRLLSDTLRGSLSLTDACRSITDIVMGQLPADYCSLMLFNRPRNALRLAAENDRLVDGGRAYSGSSRRPRCKSGPVFEAAVDHKTLFLPRVADAAGPWPETFPAEMGSVLCLPLVSRGGSIGVLNLIASGPETFNPDHLRTMTILCDQAADVLVSVQLIDELTRINRRLSASEREMRQTKEYLENLLASANDLIVTTDQKRRIALVNARADDWGFSGEKLIGRPLSDLLADPAREAAMFQSPDGRPYEVTIITPDGLIRQTLTSITPLKDERRGRTGPGGWLAIIRDITERKQLERQLLHSEKLSSVGILAAGVAHEIGNPLQGILGYVEILAKDDVTDGEKREFVAGIEQLATRINRTVRSLLDYSRPSDGDVGSVDLNRVVTDILRIYLTGKRRQRIEVETDLDQDLPPMVIDRDQIAQVVLNLVINAVQAMDEGGTLTVRTGRDEKDDRFVVVTVTDTGPGIHPEFLGQIFEPFFTTKPVGQGTGLGLAIVDRIVHQAGGRVSVESTPGQGATFRLAFPRATGG
ncbi:MAG: GAF domain-containing protein [Proteobacteria bacterium]|nr:GAF domain-containing protein [Pseudomonadota bacterium]MBU1741842.1 GAF domain-containing protein [Pseudomonadota bacterium]